MPAGAQPRARAPGSIPRKQLELPDRWRRHPPEARFPKDSDGRGSVGDWFGVNALPLLPVHHASGLAGDDGLLRSRLHHRLQPFPALWNYLLEGADPPDAAITHRMAARLCLLPVRRSLLHAHARALAFDDRVRGLQPCGGPRRLRGFGPPCAAVGVLVGSDGGCERKRGKCGVGLETACQKGTRVLRGELRISPPTELGTQQRPRVGAVGCPGMPLLFP